MTTNELKYWINTDGSVLKTELDLITSASSNVNEVILIAPWNNSNVIHSKFQIANKIAIPRKFMTLKGTEEVDGEIWNVWGYKIGSAILNTVSAYKSMPLKIAFEQKESELDYGSSGYRFQGIFPNLTSLNNSYPEGLNYYAAIGDNNSDALVYIVETPSGPSGPRVWVRDYENRTLEQFEYDQGITRKTQLMNSVIVDAPVDPGIEAIDEDIDNTISEIILEELSKLSSEIEDIKVDLPQKLYKDFSQKYSTLVEGSQTDFLIIQDSSTGINHSVTIGSLAAIINDNDQGVFQTEAELLAALPNDIPNPTDRKGWFALVLSTDTIWAWDYAANRWLDTESKGTATLEDIAALQASKSDKSDTGLFDDLDPQFKQDIEDAGLNETLADAITYVKNIASSGNGDMLKSEYATTSPGIVDKAISDGLGSNIVNTYETKTDALAKDALNEKKAFPEFTGLANTIRTAIEENKSLISANKTGVDSNTARNAFQDVQITQIFNDLGKKIENVGLQNEGNPVGTFKTLNAGEGLIIESISAGVATLTVASESSLGTASIESNETPKDITDVNVQFTTIQKDPSTTPAIEINQDGNLVFPSGGTVKFNINVGIEVRDGGDENVFIIANVSSLPGEFVAGFVFVEDKQSEDATLSWSYDFEAGDILTWFIRSENNTNTEINKLIVEAEAFNSADQSNLMRKSQYDKNDNGKVDFTDFEDSLTDYAKGDNTSAAIKSLDQATAAIDLKTQINTNNITTNASQINAKQNINDGTLLTDAKNIPGGINENKTNIDINKGKITALENAQVTKLDDLSDVKIVSPNTAHTLVYNPGNSEFINRVMNTTIVQMSTSDTTPLSTKLGTIDTKITSLENRKTNEHLLNDKANESLGGIVTTQEGSNKEFVNRFRYIRNNLQEIYTWTYIGNGKWKSKGTGAEIVLSENYITPNFSIMGMSDESAPYEIILNLGQANPRAGSDEYYELEKGDGTIGAQKGTNWNFSGTTPVRLNNLDTDAKIMALSEGMTNINVFGYTTPYTATFMNWVTNGAPNGSNKNYTGQVRLLTNFGEWRIKEVTESKEFGVGSTITIIKKVEVAI